MVSSCRELRSLQYEDRSQPRGLNGHFFNAQYSDLYYNNMFGLLQNCSF